MNDGLRQTSDVLLRAVGLHKTYFRGGEVPVLRGVDLDLHRGEFVCIVGASGCGKSTLLHLMGTLDTPTQGAVYFEGNRIDNRSPAVRDRFRNEAVGYVFQFYHLLPELTALENVMLPAMIRFGIFTFPRTKEKVLRSARELLARVGLAHRMNHKPREMSGGEMQRAAIARALLPRPQILLADEPTGNLDSETGESILELLCSLRREIGLTILMVTHNHEVSERADRTLKIAHGRIVEAVVPQEA